MSIEEIQAEIKSLEKKIEKLTGKLHQLQAEELQANAGFNVGDTVYVHEFSHPIAKNKRVWHPVIVKKFFLDSRGVLGFMFQPADKLGKNVLSTRDAYVGSGFFSITEPDPSSPSFKPDLMAEWLALTQPANQKK